MTRKIVFIFCLSFVCFTVAFAGDILEEKPRNGLSLGSIVYLESSKSGGGGELGFPFYRGNSFGIRNFIVVNGYGTHEVESAGIMSISDKITIGGFWNNQFRTYGFIEGGFGFFNLKSKGFFKSPFFWEIKGGGGIDIYTSKSFSFFVELGGGFNSVTSDKDVYKDTKLLTGFARIAVGFRNYF
jgi:hypothetical protein